MSGKMFAPLNERLDEIVRDFDHLIARCNLYGLHEVSKRLIPIRDVIQKGIELRRLVQKHSTPSVTNSLRSYEQKYQRGRRKRFRPRVRSQQP